MKAIVLKKAATTILAAALILPFAAQTPSDAAAKAPKLSSSKGTTYVGFLAKTKIKNIKKSNISKLTVKSSDSAVSVSKSGLTIKAKGVSKGSATITATLKLKKAVNKKKTFKLTYKVTVNDIDDLTSIFGDHTVMGIDFTKEYVDYIKTLDPKDFSAGLAASVVDIGVPTLLLSDGLFSDNTSSTSRAFIYNPLSKAVEFFYDCSSTSGAYPVLATDGYLLWGSHHYACKFTVNLTEKKGTVETITGLYLQDVKTLSYTKSSVNFDGSIGESKEENIAIDDPYEPGDYDFYSKAWEADKDAPVKFTKISD